jgi:hypothetical protein
MTKYNNIKVSISGYSFSSKLEAAVFCLLKQDPNIEVLQVQDHVYMTDARILFVPDFKCKNISTNEIYWAEAKGIETNVYRIKRRLWKHYGPGRLEVYMGSATRPYLKETIIPSIVKVPNI